MGNLPLNEDERRTLAILADVLIPNAESMPSFSDLELQDAPVARVLELRPELLTNLRRALAFPAGGLTPAQVVEKMSAGDPEALNVLGSVASSTYYMDKRVHELLSYPGQLSRPSTDEEEYDYNRDNLLQPVIDRGPIYRPTPD